jgi:hypothetical protein
VTRSVPFYESRKIKGGQRLYRFWEGFFTLFRFDLYIPIITICIMRILNFFFNLAILTSIQIIVLGVRSDNLGNGQVVLELA